MKPQKVKICEKCRQKLIDDACEECKLIDEKLFLEPDEKQKKRSLKLK